MAASALGGAVAASTLELVIGAVASYAISEGVEASVENLAVGAPQIAQVLDSIVQDAGGALSGVVSGTPYLPSNVSTWGSGVPSDASYIQLGSNLAPTDTTITITGQSAATAQAFGATPSGPSFTLSFNSDGTVNEAVQNVTLDSNQTTLTGNGSVTVTGVLSVGPGITGVITATSLTNGGIINVGDPTSLTISGPLENDSIVSIAAGSSLVVESPVTDDTTKVAPAIADLSASSHQSQITAQGVLPLGMSSQGAISWTGVANSTTGLGSSTPVNSYLAYGRVGNDFGTITDPALTALDVNDGYAGLATAGSAVGAHSGGFGDLLSAFSETISYSFSSAIPAGENFILWDPGAYDTNDYLGPTVTGQTLSGPGITHGFSYYDGPYTYTFTAQLSGEPVSTAGWTFSVVSLVAGDAPASSYSIDAAAGTVTVTNYLGQDTLDSAKASSPDAAVIVSPDTPIDSISVVANTTSGDEWGLSLPSVSGQIQIGNGGTADLQSSVAPEQILQFEGAAGTLKLDQPATFAGTISNFVPGDVIDLGAPLAVAAAFTSNAVVSLTFPSASYSLVGFDDQTNILTLGETSGGTFTLQFDLSEVLSLDEFRLTPNDAGGSNISLACFSGGTRIETDVGEIPVELLAVDGMVRTWAGAFAPVKWIGHRRVDCRRHPKVHAVWPVRVRPGAYGEGKPHRDLWLSPDHAVFVDGVLIPIRYLVNGKTIVQEQRDEVTYWHVELERHDVILAEGLPCESYLDTGNRGAFTIGGGAVQMHPDFALRVWDAKACAPLALDGAELEAARSWLLERAAFLGYRTTGDPDLHVMASGRELRPEIHGRVNRFRVPASAKSVRLVSRSAVPAEVRDDSSDHRRLGVAVSRMVYGGEELPLTDPRLGTGWHDLEHGGEDVAWRWTDGGADLGVGGGQVLEIEVTMTARYWLDDCPAEEAHGKSATAA